MRDRTDPDLAGQGAAPQLTTGGRGFFILRLHALCPELLDRGLTRWWNWGSGSGLCLLWFSQIKLFPTVIVKEEPFLLIATIDDAAIIGNESVR